MAAMAKVQIHEVFPWKQKRRESQGACSPRETHHAAVESGFIDGLK